MTSSFEKKSIEHRLIRKYDKIGHQLVADACAYYKNVNESVSMLMRHLTTNLKF